MKGVVCRVCRRWLQVGAVREHRCTADDAPEKRNLKAFQRNGVTWRAGVRVITQCALAGADKKEYEAGASGCVWEVLAEGVVIVCLDNSNCDVVLVAAEVGDVTAEPMLPPKTLVKCREILVRGTVESDRNTLNVIPQGVEAQVVSYDAERNSYAVRFPSLNVMAEVVTNEVQPARLPKANRLIGVAPAPEAAPSAPVDPVAQLTHQQTGVRNLARVPAYSNVTGSPRARGRTSPRKLAVTLAVGAENTVQMQTPSPRRRVRSSTGSPRMAGHEQPRNTPTDMVRSPTPSQWRQQPSTPDSDSKMYWSDMKARGMRSVDQRTATAIPVGVGFA